MDIKSILGYSVGSPYQNDPYIDIFTPEGLIDMSNTSKDLIGIDNKGNKKKMKAFAKNPYKFEGDTVREIPANPYMQRGGVQELLSYLFEDDDQEKPQSTGEPTAPSTDDLELREEEVARKEKAVKEMEQYNLAMGIATEEFEPTNPYKRTERVGNENPYIADSQRYLQSKYNIDISGKLDPDKYLNAIFGNEGGKTGVDPSIRGTASGKYAIIKSGRKDLYNKYYKSQMDYDTFENLYNTNPDFEYGVARKLAEENINNSKTPEEAIGRWYSPAHASSGQMDVIPRPDYGNKLTVRQYVNKALKNYK